MAAELKAENLEVEKLDNLETLVQVGKGPISPVVKKRARPGTYYNKNKSLELRYNKLQFKLSKGNYLFHPTTIIELAKFHSLKKENRVVENGKLVLNQFLPLLANLIQESELEIWELVGYLKHILFPSWFDSVDIWNEQFPDSDLVQVVQSIAKRVEYKVLDTSKQLEPTPLEQLTTYQWQVQDKSLFSESLRSFVVHRETQMEQLVQEAQLVYDNLSLEIKETFLAHNDTLHLKTSKRKVANLEIPLPTLEFEDKMNLDLSFSELRLNDSTTTTPVVSKEAKHHAKVAKGNEEKKPKAASSKSVEDKKLKNLVGIKGFFSPINKLNEEPSANALTHPTQTHHIELTDFQKCFHPFNLKPTMKWNFNLNHLDLDRQSPFDSSTPISNLEQSLNSILADLTSKQALLLNLRTAEEKEEPVFYHPNAVKPKLLRFSENLRPAFFGAWDTTSNLFTGRNYLKRDVQVDYEFDSDLEWQDEDLVEGENILDSDDEDNDGSFLAEDEEDLDLDEDDWLVDEDDEMELVDGEQNQELVPKVKSKGFHKKGFVPKTVGVSYTLTPSQLEPIQLTHLLQLGFHFLDPDIQVVSDPFQSLDK